MRSYIYHITTRAEWAEAQLKGFYCPPGYATDGFIHFSLLDQVVGTAGRYYKGVPDLIVLKVNTYKVKAEIHSEQAPNGGWYPHLYGILNLDAVENTIPLSVAVDGAVQFKDE
jgi:uncharacterized protein (DUF952 family)